MSRIDSALSNPSATMWAKASNNGTLAWTPLFVHMLDTKGVCETLWRSWVSSNIKSRIRDGTTFDGFPADEMTTEKLAMFISAIHDIGKCCPAFQSRQISGNTTLTGLFRKNLSDNGLEYRADLNDRMAVPHATVSELILERNGIDRSVAVIAGGHHGITPTKRDLRLMPEAYPDNTGFDSDNWGRIQEELFRFCSSSCSLNPDSLSKIRLDVEAQVLLTGIVTMSDWIASNECAFPPTGFIDPSDFDPSKRLECAMEAMLIPSRWVIRFEHPGTLFIRRFSFNPRPFQQSVGEVALSVSEPGIMILEAPMGEGKTEAALHASEILASRFGLGGVMFALPTQATADGLFPRIRGWIESMSEDSPGFHTMFLAHGKSRYNKNYNTLDHIGFRRPTENTDHGVVHDWFTGKRKGILSDFVIGTVDQVLMMGLRQRHTEMRHLGLSGKVVVIDECHAYDAYMGSYLTLALKWLGSYNVPVILLSATLPPERRSALIEAYTGNRPVQSELEREERYPLITYSDGSEIKTHCPEQSGRSLDVSIEVINDDDLMGLVESVSSSGGYVGIIVNTVRRAQNIASGLMSLLGSDAVRLLHSGFTSMDRSRNESSVLESLNSERRAPPYRLIVVGTQVMEQSMDLDFDVLFTDVCPMDLLLQRIGRLHRHKNLRPHGLESARCYIIDTGSESFDPGSEVVYGRYQLHNTRLLLREKIRVPEDIPHLVGMAYSEKGLDVPQSLDSEYRASRIMQDNMVKDKERRAKTFQIDDPARIQDLTGWLEHPADQNSSEKGEATVRDGDRSVEVVLVQRLGGTLHVIPSVQEINSCPLPENTAPDPETAFTIAGCKVPLPRGVVGKNPDRIIDMLSKVNENEIPEAWSDSEWLNGELFLVMDERMRSKIGERTVEYSEKMGMRIID